MALNYGFTIETKRINLEHFGDRIMMHYPLGYLRTDRQVHLADTIRLVYSLSYHLSSGI